MLNKITIGRYIYGTSIVHCWNPIVKLSCSFIYIITLFTLKDWWLFFLFGFILIALILQSGIRIKIYIQQIWQIRYMLIFLFLFNGLFGLSMFTNLLILLKLIVSFLYSSMILYTTPIEDLTYATTYLLTPLSWIHIPIELISHMIGLALSFLPNLLEQTNQILKSLYVRGIDYKNSNLKQKIFIWRLLLNHLLNRSFSFADSVADTMEVRLYDIRGKKNVRQLSISKIDLFLLILHIMLFLLTLLEVILCVI